MRKTIPARRRCGCCRANPLTRHSTPHGPMSVCPVCDEPDGTLTLSSLGALA